MVNKDNNNNNNQKKKKPLLLDGRHIFQICYNKYEVLLKEEKYFVFIMMKIKYLGNSVRIMVKWLNSLFPNSLNF